MERGTTGRLSSWQGKVKEKMTDGGEMEKEYGELSESSSRREVTKSEKQRTGVYVCKGMVP